MRQLTSFGLEVRKSLLERGLTVADLAKAIGAKNATIIRDMLYGTRPGWKYRKLIEDFLCLGSDDKEEAVVNE